MSRDHAVREGTIQPDAVPVGLVHVPGTGDPRVGGAQLLCQRRLAFEVHVEVRRVQWTSANIFASCVLPPAMWARTLNTAVSGPKG